MTKDLNLEAVNSALSGQVQKLLAELKAADKRNVELMAETSRLRLALQRIGRWGSPMIRGYVNAALVGIRAGGGDPVDYDQVGSVREQGAQA